VDPVRRRPVHGGAHDLIHEGAAPPEPPPWGFVSKAGNLVPDDDDGVSGIFVRGPLR
jgi:hypothetical protein